MVALAGRITGWMTNLRTKRRLDRATGLVLIGADKAPDDGYADDGVAPVHAGEADQPTYALQR